MPERDKAQAEREAAARAEERRAEAARRDPDDARPQVMTEQAYQQEQARRAAREQAEAGDVRLDESPEGGRYRVGDQLLDAFGRPVEEA